MKISLAASVIGLALAITTPQAFADANDIRAADRAVEVDFGADSLKYGESISGTTLDKENGWIPSFGAGVTWLTSPGNSPFSDLYLNLDANFTKGTDNYDGGIQSCSGTSCTVTPFLSTTDNNVFQINGKIGHYFQLNNWAALTPFVDVGFRYWRRDISGQGIVDNSVETYESGDFMGGLMLQVSPMPHLVLSFSGAGGGTLSPQMTTNGNAYHLGSSSTYELVGKAGYTLTPSLELTGTARYIGFGFGSSQVVGGSSYEPDSYTHQLSLMGGLAYHIQ